MQSAKDERGANSLEVAFIAMFLFACTAGIVDLGGAFQHYIIVINASREGARTYSRLPCTLANRVALKSAIVDSAVREASNSGLDILPKNVKVTPDPATSCPGTGAQIQVQVQDDFPAIMGALWDATTFPIRAETDMMFFGTDE
jgi:Flp pilus assembly protein TadG